MSNNFTVFVLAVSYLLVRLGEVGCLLDFSEKVRVHPGVGGGELALDLAVLLLRPRPGGGGGRPRPRGSLLDLHRFLVSSLAWRVLGDTKNHINVTVPIVLVTGHGPV